MKNCRTKRGIIVKDTNELLDIEEPRHINDIVSFINDEKERKNYTKKEIVKTISTSKHFTRTDNMIARRRKVYIIRDINSDSDAKNKEKRAKKGARI